MSPRLIPPKQAMDGRIPISIREVVILGSLEWRGLAAIISVLGKNTVKLESTSLTRSGQCQLNL